MKTVSHFNIGISLEFMLKLILDLNKKPLPKKPVDKHKLAILYDGIPCEFQRKLKIRYRESVRAISESGNYTETLVAFIHANDPPSPPPNRDISTLRGLFEYFDEDVQLWRKRYSWELIGRIKWRHYICRLDALAELITRVIAEMPSTRRTTNTPSAITRV